MVVLAPPPAPRLEAVAVILCINGGAMLAWAKHVFLHKGIIEGIEGPRAIEKKTELDAMIWKILSFWMACVGVMCIVVADTPVASQAAMLVATAHFVEMYFKSQAADRKIRRAALGNMILGSLLVVALLIDYRRPGRVTSQLDETHKSSGRHARHPFFWLFIIYLGCSGILVPPQRAPPPGEAPDPSLVA